MKTVLTVNLNPALDEIVHLDRPGPGPQRTMWCFRVFPGGKGVNVTRALRALGVRSSTVVAVAGENGRSLVRRLREEGVSAFIFRLVCGETRINQTFIEGSFAKVRRIIEAGPRWSGKDRQRFGEFFSRALGRASVLVLSGRLAPGLPVDFYAELIHEAGLKGVPVFLDTSGAALKSGIGARPFAVKPNQEEAEGFLGYRLFSRRALRNALQSFLDCGMKRILLTLGERGLAVADAKERYFVPALQCGSGHGVGCGDASLAGFIAGWQRGEDLADCARLAAACGAANLSGDVPGGIAKRAVRCFLARTEVETL